MLTHCPQNTIKPQRNVHYYAIQITASVYLDKPSDASAIVTHSCRRHLDFLVYLFYNCLH